jgi:hypothetical protein
MGVHDTLVFQERPSRELVVTQLFEEIMIQDWGSNFHFWLKILNVGHVELKLVLKK